MEFTDEFGSWWDQLADEEQVAIAAIVGLLEQRGPGLTRPYSDAVKGSRHANMRELRVQHAGRPFRLLYAFDPRRIAILSSAATRLEITAGTPYTFLSPTNCTTNIYVTHKRMKTMARKFRELREKMTPENRARAERATRELLEPVKLHELRLARDMSQQTLAEVMHIPQSAISKIEKRTDAYISTIRRYLEATGARLRIVAEFPDGECVEISQFSDIDVPAARVT